MDLRKQGCIPVDAYRPLIDHIGGGACVAEGHECVLGGGGVHGRGGACLAGEGACVAGGHAWQGGVHSGGRMCGTPPPATHAPPPPPREQND